MTFITLSTFSLKIILLATASAGCGFGFWVGRKSKRARPTRLDQWNG